MSPPLGRVGARSHRPDDRDGAYDYGQAIRDGKKWEQWNAEQQAEGIEHWHSAKRIAADPHASADERRRARDEAESLQPYADKVRRGEGAASFGMDDVTG